MNRKHYLGTPKPYLSYSQIQLFINDPRRYMEIYADGRDELRTSNRGMVYGKVVADALEQGVQTEDLLTDAAILLLPKYDIVDQEFTVDMKVGKGWVQLLAKPDSFDSVTKDILEYKTSKKMWTQKQADSSLQVKFYATCVYLKHKVIPKASLICIETAHEEGVVVPTGRVETFPVTLGLKDILETMALVTKVAKEIEVAFASHIPDKRLEW